MKEKKSDWVKIKPAELEKLVLDLHREGHSPAKIGLILRDKHAVPKAKAVGKKISQILNESNLKYSAEKDVYLKKIEAIEKHISAHKHDYTAKRSLTKSLWAVKKLN
jgi:ribosomal protein S15P/S13E